MRDYFAGVAESSLQPFRMVVAWQYVFTHPTSFRHRRIDSQACAGDDPDGICAVSTHLPEYDAFTNVQVALEGGGAESWVLAGDEARRAAATSPERISLFTLVILISLVSFQSSPLDLTRNPARGGGITFGFPAIGRFRLLAALPGRRSGGYSC